jgi:drug/metabolite transporter (DMT)-like permease
MGCLPLNRGLALLILLGAAVLEAGGDALVRAGLTHPAPARRALLFASGGLVLLAYGFLVNAPRWDFGRLLGIYVVFFFLVAQAVSWIGFGQKPTLPILAGGVCIVMGGLIMTLWKP